MNQRKFKVFIPTEIDIGYIFCCIVLEALFILWAFNGDQAIIGRVCAILFFLFILMLEGGSLLFYVKVEESAISIRTRYGRRYRFHLLDIDKVICSERANWKCGNLYYITLYIKGHEFDMEGSMNNFGKMAGYLLEKYESEEMSDTALPESCRKRLNQYGDGAIFKEKK